jgi:hypothetical protein
MRAEGLEPPGAYERSLSDSGITLESVERPEADDDPLRRSLIERALPLTWKGIWGYALAIGLLIELAKVGGFGGLLALGLFFLGAILVLRCVLQKTWWRLGDTDPPIRTYVRGRLGG